MSFGKRFAGFLKLLLCEMREISRIKFDLLSSNLSSEDAIHSKGFNNNNIPIDFLKRYIINATLASRFKCGFCSSYSGDGITSFLIGEVILVGEEA